MLLTLSIRNFAIIDRLDLEFGAGLNVLTGETGAGKSIIMGALTAILGGRTGVEMVRAGADRATIDAVFEVAGTPGLCAMLNEFGIELEDDQLLLTREINANGKSTVRICGRPSTVAQLKQIGEWLVDLHGQHEHQSLLSVARHIDMLDDWGGKAVWERRNEVREAHQELQRLRREREQIETDSRERAHLIDLYQYQVQEIDEANLRPEEEQEVQHEANRLANAQKLSDAASATAEALVSERGGGLIDTLAQPLKGLEEAAALDDTLAPILSAINSARYEMEEAGHDLVRYRESMEFNPERLEQLQDRLELIRTLKRKYGDTIEDVLAFRAETANKLELLTNSEVRGQELTAKIIKAQTRLNDLCAKLSSHRAKIGKDFAKIVTTELADLAMERTRFEVQLTATDPGSSGADKVEFVISTNPGEPLRPLARIASGGEISRVMLAIKSAMSRQDPLPTMVFDEIDVGVGGRTGVAVGAKLAGLARNAQVLCITHLAQIASRGSAHFYIEKAVHGDRTTVNVQPLSPDARINEIARMIGGADLTATVIQHAREMLAAEPA